MAQPYSTGPCGIWVAPAGSGNALFLGHSEQGAKISIRAAWEPVNNDLAGKVPLDYSFQGEEGFVSVVLTRWNEPVRQAISARWNPAGGVEGINGPFDRGTLLLHEELAYKLWLKFPFSAEAAYATLHPGMRFRRAWLESPDEHEAGVRPYKIHLLFHALVEFDATKQEFVLFDFDMAGTESID